MKTTFTKLSLKFYLALSKTGTNSKVYLWQMNKQIAEYSYNEVLRDKNK